MKDRGTSSLNQRKSIKVNNIGENIVDILLINSIDKNLSRTRKNWEKWYFLLRLRYQWTSFFFNIEVLEVVLVFAKKEKKMKERRHREKRWFAAKSETNIINSFNFVDCVLLCKQFWKVSAAKRVGRNNIAVVEVGKKG